MYPAKSGVGRLRDEVIRTTCGSSIRAAIIRAGSAAAQACRRSSPTRASTRPAWDNRSGSSWASTPAVAEPGVTFTVHAAADGQQAWALLETARFDLAVVDMVMPGISGLELVSRIRATPELAEMPVLGLTAALGPEDRQALANAGVSLVVGKPFSGRSLAAAIDTLLG